MRALVFDTKLHLETVKQPVPNKNEALIKVLTTGICNTDIEILKGYMNFKGIIGHEFAGIVERCKDKKLVGKRVVGEINIGCGKCQACINNLQRHCLMRKVLGIYNKNGTMADYTTLPIKNLFLLPDEIDPYEAVFVEPLAAACEIIEQIHITPEHTIMILGDGKLASLIAQVINLINPNLYVKGKNPQKIKLLKQLNLNAGTKLFNKKKWDIIIEATGNIQGLNIALDYVKPRGTIVLKSTFNDKTSIDQNIIVVNEITLVGSRCGNFNAAINLLKNKLVKVKPLITKIFSLENYQKAFTLATEPSSFKIIFDINYSKQFLA
jgi:threonine dehydrogenase-like Zn-dependent dehydrogenase